MRFDPKITEWLQQFVQTQKENRDYREAAEKMLAISGNKIRYNMMIRKGPETFADVIDKYLTDNLNFRLARLTREEVKAMSRQAEKIVADSGNTEKQLKTGKRPDHDSLPEDIQSYYMQTLDCVQKQRELHLQIRNLALGSATCPDSELYPFVKEIIRLDKLRLELWKKYDEWKS